MKIEITKWRYNALSPVMFMIDDLANISIKKQNDSNDILIGEDWGHYTTQKNSMWDFLNQELYRYYPHIKTTFFLVVGKREPMVKGEKYTYADSIDDLDFVNFLKYLNSKENIEIAYHGTTHGKCGKQLKDFKQEWESFSSLDEAISTIETGRNLYFKLTNTNFNGGKYCGYKKGKYGDESINKTNFTWWCRDWEGNNSLDNDTKSCDIEYFDNVIDIPSTVDGSFLSLKVPMFKKKYLKAIYMFFRYGFTLEKQINKLLDNNQVISIQEHSSPYRTDNIIQYPNIVSDMKNLKYIFSFLEDKDVWYATGSEIADYFSLYKNCEIIIKDNYFLFHTTKLLNEGTIITLLISGHKKLEVSVEKSKYYSYTKNGKTLIDVPYYKETQYKVCQL